MQGCREHDWCKRHSGSSPTLFMLSSLLSKSLRGPSLLQLDPSLSPPTRLPHWSVIFPLVVMPPSLIGAVLRVPKPVCPSAPRDIQPVPVCTRLGAIPRSRLGRGEHPRLLIGPTQPESISAHPRVCAYNRDHPPCTLTLVHGAALSKMENLSVSLMAMGIAVTDDDSF